MAARASPLFFGLGWIAARIDIQQLLHESRALPRSYFRGLNFLLNEQPDKAIDAFIEVVKVDPETVELHFALGNLFRRRGEIRARDPHAPEPARARRPAAGPEARSRSLELGAGLPEGRACSTAPRRCSRSSSTPAVGAPRARHLLEIYKQEKDWTRAIDDDARGRSAGARQKEIAQYLLRAGADGGGAVAAATRRAGHLEAALEANRKSVRANMLIGDLELARTATRRGAHRALEAHRVAEPAYLGAGRRSA